MPPFKDDINAERMVSPSSLCKEKFSMSFIWKSSLCLEKKNRVHVSITMAQ